MTFYERFNDLCKQKGLTMAKACGEMGMNPSITWRWKESTPSNKTLQKMCNYFGLTIGELMSDVPLSPEKRARQATQTGSLFDMLEDDRMRQVMMLLMDATPEQKEFLHQLLDIYDGN